MKGDFALAVLEAIGNAAVNAADLIDVFLSAGYGASYRKLDYELRKKQAERVKNKLRREETARLMNRYRNTIAWLKEDGFIKEAKRDGGKTFSLTSKGQIKMAQLKSRSNARLPETNYDEIKDGQLAIVAFDIPEKECRKRRWLRFALAEMGFNMLQKSVWIGKSDISKQFVDDLMKLKIIDFIEIFEITKSGSLRHII